ncbi:MAG: UDP-N-acetylmuramoyl-tripeptide--D-alanyl-D-alanine ligase [Acidimicrobiales bacterium]|nr:UDP-N-acetylmuramoyl-tripeptide--D-alanyl-D-alanine ligase [Acidimicrobiales bacterium]
MQMTASEIAEVTGGVLHGPDAVVNDASIDTRTIEPGQLFVPIVDARDGHDFISIALAAGCGAYLTQRAPEGGTAVVVDDTLAALTELGRHARARHTGPVIGITGSVGKTSVKDLALAAIGKTRKTHASERSFNNELGMQFTLFNAPDDAEVLIVEMGARGIGHIAALCEIANPIIGIVTYVGAVHTSEFGTVEAIAQAKGELVEALPASGRAILNADSAPVLAMRSRSQAPVITYGVGGDINAVSVVVDSKLRPSFQLVSSGQTYSVSLPIHGVHQVSNALAAFAAAEAVGVTPSQAIAGLATAGLSRWRMELGHTAGGAVVINDAYNANTISTEAALRSLAAIDVAQRFAVLGVMAELGDRHDADHRAMAALCQQLDIQLIAYQEPAYGVEVTHDFDAVMAKLGPLNRSTAVLVKGSRVAGLEALADQLTAYN